MSVVIAIFLILTGGAVFGQDAWKNIYAQRAWAARDKWQRADDLINLMKISTGSQVADVGSHEGYMTFKLAEKVGGEGMVYAVDLDSDKLEKVKARAQENNLNQVKAVKGAEDDPRLPGNLDAVIILDTYHEMKAHEAILKHIRRALRPGGRLVICDPIADERRGLARSEQERKHELEMEYAIADLKKAGFRIDFQRDNFIDRRAEKGDRMWVIVASPQ